MRQLEQALAEQLFDEDLPEGCIEKVLDCFPEIEQTIRHFIAFRERVGITDMKRGELYPEVLVGGLRLRRLLAHIYDVEQIQAQPNFGSSGCIDSFLTAVRHLELSGHDRSGLIVATPTYFRYYHKVEALGMKFLAVPFDEGYRYPVERMLDAVRRERPSAIFLTSPNNPTGVPITDDELRHMLDNLPEDLYVGIDRTCANTEPEIATRELIKKHSNKKIAVFHSFSKYHCMSHLRIGFSLVSDLGFAAKLDCYRPFGLNLESLLRASHILTSKGELRPKPEILARIKDNRQMMRDFVAEHGQYSCTNFASNYALLFLPNGIDCHELCSRLATLKIFVMPGYELPEPDERYLRIHTAGQTLFVERLVSALIDFGR